jgi:hypothetical protein
MARYDDFLVLPAFRSPREIFPLVCFDFALCHLYGLDIDIPIKLDTNFRIDVIGFVSD